MCNATLLKAAKAVLAAAEAALEEAESVLVKAKIEFWIADDAARREEAVLLAEQLQNDADGADWSASREP